MGTAVDRATVAPVAGVKRPPGGAKAAAAAESARTRAVDDIASS